MLRKAIGISLVALSGLVLAMPVVAQDSTSGESSLTERLERVRRNLSSEAGDQNSRTTAAADDAGNGGSNGVLKAAFTGSSYPPPAEPVPEATPMDDSATPPASRFPRRIRLVSADGPSPARAVPPLGDLTDASPAPVRREPVLVDQQEASPPTTYSSRRRVDDRPAVEAPRFATPRIATRENFAPSIPTQARVRTTVRRRGAG